MYQLLRNDIFEVVNTVLCDEQLMDWEGERCIGIWHHFNGPVVSADHYNLPVHKKLASFESDARFRLNVPVIILHPQ